MAKVNNWTWRVSSLYTSNSVPGKPNHVSLVTWRLAGTDGVKETEVGNNLHLENNPDQETFIAYSDLSEETVLGWVKSSLGEEGILEYQDKVQGIIDSMYAAEQPVDLPVYTQLPWVE